MNAGLEPACVGLEIEMIPVHQQKGTSLPVQAYFGALADIKRSRGLDVRSIALDERCVGLRTPWAECGLDNGFNLLETALAPVSVSQGGLGRLADLAHQELADTIQALQSDQACILNASQHPDCPRDASWYDRVCVPRPIYRELRAYRGWHHAEGIDAKSQNGANTSVPVAQAVQALNVLLALAPAKLALFANSPLESGRITGFKETRMTLWPRVFGPARFPGDLRLSVCPDRPFSDLRDFFGWMFGPGTVSRSLPQDPGTDYKDARTIVLDGDPCLLQALQAGRWPGRYLDTGEPCLLTLDARHFEYSQIGQFLDARLRYRWGSTPSSIALLTAWRTPQGLEALFDACGAQVYLEGRVPGAGFADACLLSEAGAPIARSMLMAPLALQSGLLANLGAATDLVQSWGWAPLRAMRQTAMARGLDDAGVRTLCAEVLAVALGGLRTQDQPHLAYAQFVQESGRSAADRFLDTWRSLPGDPPARLAGMLKQHTALHPTCYGAL